MKENEDVIINKVAQSAIETIDLEKFLPTASIEIFDLKNYLFMEMILKEKDFREQMKNLDWNIFENKIVGIVCSADAIIPLWAYMLVATYLQPVAQEFYYGNEEEIKTDLLLKNIRKICREDYAGKRVVLKGCGDENIPPAAYLEATKLLVPVVKSIMYGEPCSTVPIYKSKN